MPASPDLHAATLSTIVREAWADGQDIDLTEIGYGRIHWGNRADIRDDPLPYYHFLAGIVHRFGFSSILEIGTHWGGATRAMWHGMADHGSAKIVTVDLTTDSDEALQTYPGIVKIVGNGNSEDVFTKVLAAFANTPVDLVYIDASHELMATVTSFAVYRMALRPRLIICDDVNLNEGMKRAWQLIQAALPQGDTINAAEVVQAIRPTRDNPGFGVARLDTLVAS